MSGKDDDKRRPSSQRDTTNPPPQRRRPSQRRELSPRREPQKKPPAAQAPPQQQQRPKSAKQSFSRRTERQSPELLSRRIQPQQRQPPQSPTAPRQSRPPQRDPPAAAAAKPSSRSQRESPLPSSRGRAPRRSPEPVRNPQRHQSPRPPPQSRKLQRESPRPPTSRRSQQRQSPEPTKSKSQRRQPSPSKQTGRTANSFNFFARPFARTSHDERSSSNKTKSATTSSSSGTSRAGRSSTAATSTSSRTHANNKNGGSITNTTNTNEEFFRCMAGFPPAKTFVALKVPYGAWYGDTLICDERGDPVLSVLAVRHEAMGQYQAIFGDADGNRLAYVTRRLMTNFGRDGWDFCTYQPNFENQPEYKEKDLQGRTVYPFSSLDVLPFRTKYDYKIHHENLKDHELVLQAHHGWLGATTVCCTPMVRMGKWQIDFRHPQSKEAQLNIDQTRNLLEIERGNDILAALCIAYAFDKALCQPLVTIIGYREVEYDDGNKKPATKTKKVVRKTRRRSEPEPVDETSTEEVERPKESEHEKGSRK